MNTEGGNDDDEKVRIHRTFIVTTIFAQTTPKMKVIQTATLKSKRLTVGEAYYRRLDDGVIPSSWRA